MNELKLTEVKKHYGNKSVLDGVTVQLQPNTIYGLLGRNGAGKSTLLNIVTNRIPATAGSVTMNDRDVTNNDEALQQMYLMSEANLYNPRLRVNEIFKETARMYGGFNFGLASRLAHEFGLNVNARNGKLSTGYRSIYKLIVALCVPADYIFLDEPTLGLDANHRDLFYRTLMDTYAERPRTFVIATHLIEEIAHIIERLVIIKTGSVLVDSSVEETLAQSHVILGPQAEVAAYTAGLNVIGEESLGQLKVRYVYGALDDKILPDTVRIDGMDLQKLFIELTNEEGDEHVI
ncbi:ABC transporter ATP-binding protein [Secundilactobacillus oryzae JCM 18671]|uniref:ABC transporter ATP-binding protein n=1 Tax=Secundilactobacillus oryzae JCM 18671 TaxID=1291743 RepID=A0A081BIS3_9LACO|nr:ABC transporter ATP-binding protein [Secundilactobacillus oryzae]GAK47941.1 ABC transporter ATP-binding protein [Secundilactobacillus oryzae JCM 18671]